MNFTKLQGAGNDFILVEAGEISRDWSPMAVAICDRHFGIGADGLLLLLPSDSADFQMQIFNADGSEAEACGNGLRCLVKYIVDTGLVDSETQEISVETAAGIRKARIYRATGKPAKIQIGMGEPKFRAEDIPVVIETEKGSTVDIKPILSHRLVIEGRELLLNFVSMGNPHAIYFCQHPVSDFPLSQLGPEVEQHKMFPNRTNCCPEICNAKLHRSELLNLETKTLKLKIREIKIYNTQVYRITSLSLQDTSQCRGFRPIVCTKLCPTS